jgi:hypothetical protein
MSERVRLATYHRGVLKRECKIQEVTSPQCRMSASGRGCVKTLNGDGGAVQEPLECRLLVGLL